MAAHTYKIKIENTIVDGENKVGKETKPTDIKKATSNQKTEKKSDTEVLAVYAGKQALSYAVGNYGTLTGNKIQGAALQGAIGLAGDAFMIAKYGSLGIAMVAIDAGTKLASLGTQKAIQNREAEMLRIRTGGSR